MAKYSENSEKHEERKKERDRGGGERREDKRGCRHVGQEGTRKKRMNGRTNVRNEEKKVGRGLISCNVI